MPLNEDTLTIQLQTILVKHYKAWKQHQWVEDEVKYKFYTGLYLNMLCGHELEDNYRDFLKLDAEELDLVFAIASQVKEKQDTKQIISDIKQGLDEHLEAVSQKQQEGRITTQELWKQME